ncbi:MAG: hypothetical protein WC374_04780 [Phycisphaerae bacterium]|jgi:hypothetical protein
MAKYTTLQRYFTTEGLCERKGEYLAEYGSPGQCAEVLMQNLAGYIGGLAEPQMGETLEDADFRLELGADYIQVLTYMMDKMKNEVYPAIQRLNEKESKWRDARELRQLEAKQQREKARRDKATSKILGLEE